MWSSSWVVRPWFIVVIVVIVVIVMTFIRCPFYHEPLCDNSNGRSSNHGACDPHTDGDSEARRLCSVV